MIFFFPLCVVSFSEMKTVIFMFFFTNVFCESIKLVQNLLYIYIYIYMFIYVFILYSVYVNLYTNFIYRIKYSVSLQTAYHALASLRIRQRSCAE